MSPETCSGLPLGMMLSKSWNQDKAKQYVEILLGEVDFSNRGKVHDWRNHVPELFRENWNHICDQAKFALIACASEAAEKEEWDY